MLRANFDDGQLYFELNALSTLPTRQRKRRLHGRPPGFAAMELDDRDVANLNVERPLKPFLDGTNLLGLMWIREAR